MDLARASGSDALVSLIAGFSFLGHFDALQKGVVSLPDVIFFLGMTGFWLVTAWIIVAMNREDG